MLPVRREKGWGEPGLMQTRSWSPHSDAEAECGLLSSGLPVSFPLPSSSTCWLLCSLCSVPEDSLLRTCIASLPTSCFPLLPCIFISRYPSVGSLCDLAMLLVFTVSFHFLYCHRLFFSPLFLSKFKSKDKFALGNAILEDWVPN